MDDFEELADFEGLGPECAELISVLVLDYGWKLWDAVDKARDLDGTGVLDESVVGDITDFAAWVDADGEG